ncbi:MAG TPA: carboxymuconolactone decarboxylase family protein [Rectinemataceae bacterium]|nr:carboxymuconolactone decarboxylase family protein [Rectinemataceae bacterium]
MDKRKENWSYFQERHARSHKAYEEFGKALSVDGPLGEREQALIKVGVAAASQYDYALRSHIERARVCGCTDEEIEHAILLVATTAGFPRMMTALLVMREEFEAMRAESDD